MSDFFKFTTTAASCDEKPEPIPHHAFTIALVGNPNAGKTTLFNALTGLRAKTANFPGTTVERRVGRAQLGDRQIVIVDLPGLYSLESSSPDEKIASDALHGRLAEHPAPNAALVVVDATNLERNLFLVSQVLELDCPVVVALNMMDTARRDGIRIDVAKLRAELGCPVIPISARSGLGLGELQERNGKTRHRRNKPGRPRAPNRNVRKAAPVAPTRRDTIGQKRFQRKSWMLRWRGGRRERKELMPYSRIRLRVWLFSKSS